MKLASKIAQETIGVPAPSDKIVHRMAVIGGWRELDAPMIASSLKCLVCGGSSFFCPLIDPTREERVWICADAKCASTRLENCSRNSNPQARSGRAILWPLFCEINGIGDMLHGVVYEQLQQSDEIRVKIKDFLTNSKPFLVLYGDKGTGKTYTALSVCEYFTRRNTSCIFTTQKRMSNDWIDTFKTDKVSNYIARITRTDLLVIDDFGTSDIAPKFMGFFMDVMNDRMQWKGRKTIITTNLAAESLAKYCGDALVDRLRTGTFISFTGKSKRS